MIIDPAGHHVHRVDGSACLPEYSLFHPFPNRTLFANVNYTF